MHSVHTGPGGECSNHWALKGQLWFLGCRILLDTEKHRVPIIVLILTCCVCITAAVVNLQTAECISVSALWNEWYVDSSRFPSCRRPAAYQSNKDAGIVQKGKVSNFLFNNSTEGIAQLSWMYDRIKIGELSFASLWSWRKRIAVRGMMLLSELLCLATL